MSEEEHATPRWEARPLDENETQERAARPTAEPPSGEEGFWSAHWERFRRQQVDDPVPERREGMWDRFRRQDVDAPVRGART
jgi:hypothetical protein